MMRAILNKSWRQHPTKQQLYGHLPPITKTSQVRRTRPAGHCWRRRDELISDVLQWTPTYGRAKAERLARTYIQQLCEDTGCSLEDLPEAMNDRDERGPGISMLAAWHDDDDDLIYILKDSSIHVSVSRDFDKLFSVTRFYRYAKATITLQFAYVRKVANIFRV